MPGGLGRARRRAALAACGAVVALAGCGGHAPSVASCLNAKGFLVQERAGVVRGSSPRGVVFRLALYREASAARRAYAASGRTDAALLGDAVVDFAGNPPASPGAPPRRLTTAELATIGGCLARR